MNKGHKIVESLNHRNEKVYAIKFEDGTYFQDYEHDLTAIIFAENYEYAVKFPKLFQAEIVTSVLKQCFDEQGRYTEEGGSQWNTTNSQKPKWK